MNWRAVKAIARRDLQVVARNGAVLGPMIAVPVILLVVLSAVTFAASRSTAVPDAFSNFLQALPEGAVQGLQGTPGQRLAVLLATYVVPPLMVVIPLMAASVLATDAIAGERERCTIEGLMLSPVTEQEILVGKILGALVPAVTLGLLCHLTYAVVVDIMMWPSFGGLVLPTAAWLLTVLWFGPAFTVSALGLIVIVSARAKSVQGAYQVSGICVLPLIMLTIGQGTGVVVLVWWVALAAGALLWAAAYVLIRLGARAMSREQQLVTLG